MMLYRKLGSSGIEASVVAYGAWAIGGWMWGGTDENESVKAIHSALDHGINFIDTAPIYGFGRSEQIVGRAIKGKRDKVVLATKCGIVWGREIGEFYFYSDDKERTDSPAKKKVYKSLNPGSIADELEKSLKRLGTDYIDLYQTHWQEMTTPIEDVIAVLLKFKDAGKIRAIGVSNANLDRLKAYGPIASDQERYNMLDRTIEQNGSLDYCRSNNIAMLAFCPLDQGLLTGKVTADRKFGEGDQRNKSARFTVENRLRVNAMLEEFGDIAQKYEVTLTQLVIAWTFSQAGVSHVLCGIRNEKQAIENAGAGDLSLSADDLKAMDAIIAKYTDSVE